MILGSPSSAVPSATLYQAGIDELSKLLTSWSQSRDSDRVLCISLAHQYTKAGLPQLKGVDASRFEYLKQACEKSASHVPLLAELNRYVYLDDEYYPEVEDSSDDDIERPDESLVLKDIQDPFGNVVCHKKSIDDSFLCESLYRNRAPDEQTGGENLGNEHAEIFRRYTDAVLIVLDLQDAAEFLTGMKSDRATLNKFLQNCPVSCKHDNSIISQLVDHVSRQWLQYQVDEDTVASQIYLAALKTCNHSLATLSLTFIQRGLSEEIFEPLGNLLEFDDVNNQIARYVPS